MMQLNRNRLQTILQPKSGDRAPVMGPNGIGTCDHMISNYRQPVGHPVALRSALTSAYWHMLCSRVPECTRVYKLSPVCNNACLQSLTIDVSKLKCIVRLADMMLCGVAVGMLLEGVGGLQARLASQAPLLVEPAFSPQGVYFQPEGSHMLKVAHSSTAHSQHTHHTPAAHSLHPHCSLIAHSVLAHCLLARSLTCSLTHLLTTRMIGVVLVVNTTSISGCTQY